MSARFYLLIIAGLMLITTINHRDSGANLDYKCYVYAEGCK